MTNTERILKQLKLKDNKEQINIHKDIKGIHSNIWGNFKNISGNVSYISGDVSDISGGAGYCPLPFYNPRYIKEWVAPSRICYNFYDESLRAGRIRAD